MKVIITQSALSTGVITHDAEPSDNPKLVRFAGRYNLIFIWKPHWHTDKAEALAQVRLMADKRRNLLEKGLAELPAKLAAAEKAIEDAQL